LQSRRDILAQAVDSPSNVQDYLKTFLIALVTSVAVLFALGPLMLRLQEPQGPRQQVEAPVGGKTDQALPQPAQLTAPNLQGLDLRDARERWRNEGIVIIEDSQRIDTTVEAGTILSQTPSGGAPLQTKEIRVVVAAAPEMVTVPSVIGKSESDAIETLVEAGFEVPTSEKESSSEKPGQVLRQEPNAGSKSEKGSLVRLVVSGKPDDEPAVEPEPQDELVEVPKLYGMGLSSAKKKIQEAGLVVGSVREREHPELGNHRVLSQDPSAGSKVAKGTAVDLVVVTPEQ
jgi:beta-lactam-binding protein with PASTA domain